MKIRTKLTIGLIAVLLFFLLLVFGDKIFKPVDYTSEINNMTYDEIQYIESVRSRAMDYAIKCSKLTVDSTVVQSLKWAIHPRNKITIVATDGKIDLDGFYDPHSHTIYVAYPQRVSWWILAHESLHAIGIVGHPDTPFRHPCQLMPDQN